MEFADLRKKLSDSASAEDLERLDQAFEFARKGHEGQVRADGSPYVHHPVAVADILSDLNLPVEVLEAALLHDVVEDNDEISLEDIHREFGDAVASLVDGVTKLTELPRVSRAGESASEVLSPITKAKLRKAETIRKTILSMNTDVRVVLIKLADRLHNMRTLGSLRLDKQKRVAQETLEIFAPLANRLGMRQMKWQLEDVSFRYVEPQIYREISQGLAQRREEREQGIQIIVEKLRRALAEHSIPAEVTGRPKHIYSIFRKMQRRQVPLEQVSDVRAVRVITETMPQCYMALGVVHGIWRPVPSEFDDYIASPKDNFYQSLHTSVVCEDGKALEVQIRTREMHRHAEYGIASHWRYKEKGRKFDESFERRLRYLRSMIDWHDDVTEGEAFVEALKTDVFRERVYAFTPRGDALDLPLGATPIDFAYHIHTEVGHRCRGGKVNGRLVGLNHRLSNGDRVEILTTKRGGPSRDWLNPDLGYIASARARAKIRAWFRRQNRDQHIGSGRAMVERELKRLSIRLQSLDEVAEVFGYDDVEEFFARVGRGDISMPQILQRLVKKIQDETGGDELDLPPSVIRAPDQRVSSEDVSIQGVDGLLTHLGRCCSPVQGDPIVGFTTRGRGVTIHRRDCPNILRLGERERLISVSWGGLKARTFPVPTRIVAFDREGLLRDIADIVAEEKISMSSVFVPPVTSYQVVVSITLEVADLSQLVRTFARIEQLPNVVSVQRIKG